MKTCEEIARFIERQVRIVRLLRAVEDLLSEITVLAFDVAADAEYGKIRVDLEAAGKPIGGNDMLIAAHARATGATIVTATCGLSTMAILAATWPHRPNASSAALP